MENKINIAELLKDCPKGMELDCSVFEDVTLYKIDTDIENEFPIRIKTKNDYFLDLTKYGTYSNVEEAKCVIFPKGKITWEGFVLPKPKFKCGDIVACDCPSGNSQLFIFKEYDDDNDYAVCYLFLSTGGTLDIDEFTWKINRLATEEEKQKLFDAIKANGYKWNTETKTLEKLIESKFYEGQWITDGYVGGQITSIENNYPCYKIADFMGGINTSIPFTLQDNYHLWTIQDAKDGDVLAAYECLVLFKKLDGLNIKCYCTYHFMNNPSFYVDTLQNKDAFHPATKEEKQKLFDAIKANGYKWNAETKTLEKLIKPKFKVGDKIKRKNGYRVIEIIKIVEDGYYNFKDDNDEISCFNIEYQDDYELVPNKFDINTLVPFESRVLVREDKTDVWRPTFYGFFHQHSKRFYTTSCGTWLMCIPYNERTMHLTGTTNDCNDFYKTWEK